MEIYQYPRVHCTLTLGLVTILSFEQFNPALFFYHLFLEATVHFNFLSTYKFLITTELQNSTQPK